MNYSFIFALEIADSIPREERERKSGREKGRSCSSYLSLLTITIPALIVWQLFEKYLPILIKRLMYLRDA